MTRRLIVNADDYGLTQGTADAILSAHRDGIVTSTSVLALAPGSLDRVERLDATDLAVGVHLALVGEDPPVLAASEIPTLVDRRGRLAGSWRTLVMRLGARRVDPDDVRRELGAQIEAVQGRLGRALAHLDSHQHVHVWPSVAEVVVELAVRHRIGRVRVPRPTSRRHPRIAMEALASRLARRLEQAGIAHTHGFTGVDQAGRWTEATLGAAISDPAWSGSLEIGTHPGAAEDAARARYAWGYGWGEEHVALTSPGLRVAVERAGWELVGTLTPTSGRP